jgi:hypothetical protein
MVISIGVGSQACDGLSAKRVLMVSLASVRAVDFEPRVHLMSISERSERVELEMLPTRKFPPLQKMMGHCPSACR